MGSAPAFAAREVAVFGRADGSVGVAATDAPAAPPTRPATGAAVVPLEVVVAPSASVSGRLKLATKTAATCLQLPFIGQVHTPDARATAPEAVIENVTVTEYGVVPLPATVAKSWVPSPNHVVSRTLPLRA